MPSPQEYQDAAETNELLGEELVKRGEYMLDLGRKLLSQAVELGAAAEGLAAAPTPLAEERSVGKRGEVRFGMAVEAAKQLGHFTRAELGDALGLNQGQTNKWIARLINNKPWPIIRRVARGYYDYIGPKEKPPDPTEAPEHASAVEAAAGVGADRTVTGQVIPYTGRPMGSTGKPGRDKKLSAKRRVRRKGGQILGG